MLSASRLLPTFHLTLLRLNFNSRPCPWHSFTSSEIGNSFIFHTSLMCHVIKSIGPILKLWVHFHSQRPTSKIRFTFYKIFRKYRIYSIYISRIISTCTVNLVLNKIHIRVYSILGDSNFYRNNIRNHSFFVFI